MSRLQSIAQRHRETRDAIAEIRRLVHALRPPALDELGLVGALREQAALLTRAQASTFRSMRERAYELGGSFSAGPGAPHGTRI